LQQRTRIPICASETLAGKASFRQLFATNALDVVVLDLSWCGGLTEARKIAALAESMGRLWRRKTALDLLRLWPGCT
jgi:L-alanine-DL-glutamate epimerase-like enolase superfamily enzyme